MTVQKPSSLLFVKLLFNDPLGRRSESLTTGIMRVIWLFLPLLCGPSLANSFNDFKLLLRTTVSISLWAFWALILLSTLIATPVSLAVIRIGAPAAAAVSLVGNKAIAEETKKKVGLQKGAYYKKYLELAKF